MPYLQIYTFKPHFLSAITFEKSPSNFVGGNHINLLRNTPIYSEFSRKLQILECTLHCTIDRSIGYTFQRKFRQRPLVENKKIFLSTIVSFQNSNFCSILSQVSPIGRLDFELSFELRWHCRAENKAPLTLGDCNAGRECAHVSSLGPFSFSSKSWDVWCRHFRVSFFISTAKRCS